MNKYKVEKSKCAGCGTCINFCPHGAIKIDQHGKANIDQKKCQKCGACIEACPFEAINKIPEEENRLQRDLPPLSDELFSSSENFSNDIPFSSNNRKTGRGMGAGRGRGFGEGPRDGRGGGRGGGGRNRNA